MKPTLLVLAAGMGSRYGGLKQLDPVGPSGETIIDYSIFDAIRAGFGKVVFVIRHDIETAFKEKFDARYRGHIVLDYAFQELRDLPAGFAVPAGREKPWGTGHAILAARNLIREPFAVINADDFYGAASYKVLAEHLFHARDTQMADYCMVGFQLRNTLSEFGTVSRGICGNDTDGNLISAEELTKIARSGNGAVNTDEAGNTRQLTGDEIVSMNMWGFTPSLFGHLETLFKEFLRTRGHELKSEFYIPFAVNTLIEKRLARAKVLTTPESWFGVTYREDKPTVVSGIRKRIDDGIYPEKLF